VPDYLVEVEQDSAELTSAPGEALDILISSDPDGQIISDDSEVIEILVSTPEQLLTNVVTETVDVLITTDSTGVVVSDVQDVEVVELLEDGPQGPPGPPGPVGFYTHVQTNPAAEWPINHNLGARAMPTLILASNPSEPVFTDVVFVDENSLLVQWTQPETGWAYI